MQTAVKVTLNNGNIYKEHCSNHVEMAVKDAANSDTQGKLEKKCNLCCTDRQNGNVLFEDR